MLEVAAALSAGIGTFGAILAVAVPAPSTTLDTSGPSRLHRIGGRWWAAEAAGWAATKLWWSGTERRWRSM